MANARRRLKAGRQRQGLTQEQLANRIGVALSTYRDWEQGRSVPHPGHRRRLAEELRVPMDELAIMLADEDRTPDGHVVPQWLSLLASLEQGASRLWAWEPVTIHGLLQTSDYATAVERMAVDSTPEKVVERVRARMARQGVLTRDPDPLRLSVVLDESTLLRVTGGPQVMAEQLEHLIAMAARPNVELQVLPLGSGVHVAGWGMFTVLAKSESVPHLVCDSDATGVRYHESEHAIRTHLDLFGHLAAMALTPEASADTIRTILKERYR